MVNPAKRRRIEEHANISVGPTDSDVTDQDADSKPSRRKQTPTSANSDDELGAGSSDAIETDLDDESSEDDVEQARMQAIAERKASKRPRRRAVSPSRFGETLESLLNIEAPSGQPLSLKPSIARKRREHKLDGKAKRVLEDEVKVKREQNHISDLIGGWGGESERALRKVAQRGVVKLFNAIQQSHQSAAVAQENLKLLRGSGKPTLPAPKISKQKKNKDEMTKTGVNMDHDDFLGLIRSGGVVSKI